MIVVRDEKRKEIQNLIIKTDKKSSYGLSEDITDVSEDYLKDMSNLKKLMNEVRIENKSILNDESVYIKMEEKKMENEARYDIKKQMKFVNDKYDKVREEYKELQKSFDINVNKKKDMREVRQKLYDLKKNVLAGDIEAINKFKAIINNELIFNAAVENYEEQEEEGGMVTKVLNNDPSFERAE